MMPATRYETPAQRFMPFCPVQLTRKGAVAQGWGSPYDVWGASASVKALSRTLVGYDKGDLRVAGVWQIVAKSLAEPDFAIFRRYRICRLHSSHSIASQKAVNSRSTVTKRCECKAALGRGSA